MSVIKINRSIPNAVVGYSADREAGFSSSYVHGKVIIMDSVTMHIIEEQRRDAARWQSHMPIPPDV